MNPWTPWLPRLGRWLAALAGLAALLLALGIGAFRLAIELLPDYQQRVVERVREATGLTLQFDSVYARIGRYGPEIVFRGARVLPEFGDEPLVSAEAGRVSLSIPRSIWYRRPEVARVLFVRPKLGLVITTNGSIRFVGQSVLQRPDAETRPMTLERLPRGRYGISDAVLEVLDLRARQGRFELTGVDLEVLRVGDEITLTGRVALPEHLGSFIEFDGQASGELADNEAVSWRARVDARNLDLEQWAAMLPDSFRVPAAGRGSIRASARGTGRFVSSLRLEPQLADLRLPGSQTEFSRIAGNIRRPARREQRLARGHGARVVAPGGALAPDQPCGERHSAGRTRHGSHRAGGLPQNREPRRVRGLAASRDAAGANRDARASRRADRRRCHGARRGRAPVAGHQRAIALFGRRLPPDGQGGRDHRIRRRDRGSGRRWHRRGCGSRCDARVAAAMARARGC